MQILIVDDHSGVRLLIRELLEDCLPVRNGREIAFHECACGEDAVAAVAAVRPELVTVDLRMPGMSGLDCVRRLRERLPLACIVVVTQFGNDSLQERARGAGADAVVFKDDLNQLQQVARGYLSQR